MANNEVQINVTATIGDRTIECDLSKEMKGFYSRIPVLFLKAFIAQTTNDAEIINVFAEDPLYEEELVYNPYIGSELADRLADKLGDLTSGTYRESYHKLLSNPSLSPDKLDALAAKHLVRYRQGNTEWFLDSDMLCAIAMNPSAGEATLNLLSYCGIPKVENAARQTKNAIAEGNTSKNDVEVNEHGVNIKIQFHELDEQTMIDAGFKKNYKGNWYYIKYRRYKSLELSFNVLYDETGLNIMCLDEAFCQPYDYQYMESMGNSSEYTEFARKFTESQVEKLQDLGILSGHVPGEYI